MRKRPCLRQLLNAAHWMAIAINPFAREPFGWGLNGTSDAELGACALYGGLVIAEGKQHRTTEPHVSVAMMTMMMVAREIRHPVWSEFIDAGGDAWHFSVRRMEAGSPDPIPLKDAVAAGGRRHQKSNKGTSRWWRAARNMSAGLVNIWNVGRLMPAMIQSSTSIHPLPAVGRSVRPMATLLEGRVPAYVMIGLPIGAQMLVDYLRSMNAERFRAEALSTTYGAEPMGDWMIEIRRSGKPPTADQTESLPELRRRRRYTGQGLALAKRDLAAAAGRPVRGFMASYQTSDGNHRLTEVEIDWSDGLKSEAVRGEEGA